MKRINPQTKKPFKYGDLRHDGYVFIDYVFHVNKTGFFRERWTSPEKFNGRQVRNRKNNILWAKLNPEKRKLKDRRWAKNNLAKANAKKALRRSRKLQRTPPWLNDNQKEEIRNLYKQSQLLSKSTGMAHHVDHIVPLKGETVSGLHVPWNLQILTEKENLQKRNKF